MNSVTRISNSKFTVFPALDVKGGKVVRLIGGNLRSQIAYGIDPETAAYRWFEEGAKWLHVINLDAAFNEVDTKSRNSIKKIVKIAQDYGGHIQLGGGLRSIRLIEQVFDWGVDRAVLGSLIVNQPTLLPSLLLKWGPNRIIFACDTFKQNIQINGWKNDSGILGKEFIKKLKLMGLEWLIYSEVESDGKLEGINLDETINIAESSGLSVIASGGVRNIQEIQTLKQNMLAGVIIGRALYERTLNLKQIFSFI